MKILVVNDDGINAAGIKTLVKHLSKIAKVVVVAPESQRSGAGSSIVVGQIRVKKENFENAEAAYSISGTPRDCAEIGLARLFPNQIDMLISGINQGANVGSDTICSGTCGAALIGTLYGIPSIATSLDFGDSYEYEDAAEITTKIAQWLIEQPSTGEYTLNVNIPNIPKDEMKGYKTCGFGGFDIYKNCCTPVQDGEYLIYDTEISNNTFDTTKYPDGDRACLSQGYICLSPMHPDLTCYKFMKNLETLK